MSDEKICRYCLDDSTDLPLIAPCDCKGSTGFVHETCVLKWMRVSDTQTCEVCHAPFACRLSRWQHVKATVKKLRFEVLCYFVLFVLFMAPICIFKSIAAALLFHEVLTYDQVRVIRVILQR
jgi:E3 ubiquitin-protein ligase DOA10